MQDKSKVIFGNEISSSDYKSACNSKAKFIKKYGDDSKADYQVTIQKNPYMYDLLGIKNVLVGPLESNNHYDPSQPSNSHDFDDNALIVGNIRMGFGHYRISMAIASAARHMGFTPYWMDLNSYNATTCTKVIESQNKLYSLGSRLSKNPAFNKAVWEPMNYEGFRALSYNASDQKNAELMTPVFAHIPAEVPFIGTHVWPAQAAVHAGMTHVVNAIPDNWPMALHLSEGAMHTIQCKNAYMGYRVLNGMNKKKVCRPMPQESLVYTGHYIDHELVANIEDDCKARIERKNAGKPIRFFLTIGGAGAQKEIFAEIIKHLIPHVKAGKAAIYVNVGDYKAVWDELIKSVPGMKELSKEHFQNWGATQRFATKTLDPQTQVEGIHGFYHENIFEAVYATNLLMRSADVLITKPSELAFYPVPKLFIKRVGKHEMWGAIHSAEIGDGTLETRDIPHTLQMVDMFLNTQLLDEMCENIQENNRAHLYDGAYKVVELATQHNRRNNG